VDFRYLVYNLLDKGKRRQLGALFTGSTIKHLTGEKPKTFMIEVPTKQLIESFSKMVEPMSRQVEVLTKRNTILRTPVTCCFPN